MPATADVQARQPIRDRNTPLTRAVSKDNLRKRHCERGHWMHVHPDITIAIVDREHRARAAAARPSDPAAPARRRARLGTAVVRLGARLGRFDVIVVADTTWRGRTAAM